MSQPPNVILRAPRPDEAARLHEIERACFSDPWPASSFEALCRREDMACIVAELGGVTAGYWVGQRIDDEAELLNLAVDPAYRSRGIGRALLQHFIEAVGGPARTTIFLEVRASNSSALDLYLLAGFEALDRRANYYSHPTEDAIVMARHPGALPSAFLRPSPPPDRVV
jgi:[ribosomal protein S18]-alanine N-acetyltransferase